MDIEEKYEMLPIIDVRKDTLTSLDQDKSESKITSLINKYIILEVRDEDGIIFMPSKLLKYKDGYLFNKPYNYIGPDFFKDFEKLHIDRVRGIERYHKSNPGLKFRKEFKNSICEITDRDSNAFTVLVNDFDNFEVEFRFKYKDEDGVCIGTGTYPICLVKEIRIINN